jgi:hypothetical protein
MTTEGEIYSGTTQVKVHALSTHQDPETCAQYLRLTLEFINYLGSTYPHDAK